MVTSTPRWALLTLRRLSWPTDQDKLQFAAADGPMAVFGEDLVDLQNKGLINADVLTATNDNCVQDFANGQGRHVQQWYVGAVQRS